MRIFKMRSRMGQINDLGASQEVLLDNPRFVDSAIDLSNLNESKDQN